MGGNHVHDTERSRGGDDRGISEILGTVLLLSMVLVGSAVVVVIGAGAITDMEERTDVEAAETHLQDIGTQLSTLGVGSDTPTTEIDLTDTKVRDYTHSRDGWINVTVNGNGSTSFERNLTTIRFESTEGERVAYEAGGVWRGGLDNSNHITSPDLTFEEGTLELSLTNLTGHLDKSANSAILNVSRTENSTTSVLERLRQGEAIRPDYLNISVNSEFQDGWADYLQGEIGLPSDNVQTFSNGTVRADVPQDLLHPSANDEVNNVVNLSDDHSQNYMHKVEKKTGGEHPIINVSKDASNTYSVFVEPLSEDTLEVGRTISIDDETVTGPPLDVSLVLDESGSMADPACTGCPETRMEAAKDSAQNFAGYLNESRDRISLQSYNSESHYRHVDDSHFSMDFDAVNTTIDGLSAGGGTRIDRGLNASNTIMELKSNDTRRKVTVLLTDGENNRCDDGDPVYECDDNVNTLEAAWHADNNSVTVYTIGFGSDSEIEQKLMKDVANATDGAYYHATNSDELQEAFESIRDNIRAEDVVAKTPLTTNLSTDDGRAFSPEIPGDVNHIANVSNGDEKFLNINDPTAPRLFTHSFAVKDGTEVELNMTGYECAPGAWNYTGQVREQNGQTFSVARCTDITSANGSFNSRIYVDGDEPHWLLGNDRAPWERDVNESIDSFPGVDIDDVTGELSAKSNQALVVYDVPPEGPDTWDNDERNKIALLYQIGLAESEAQGVGIIDVKITEASLE